MPSIFDQGMKDTYVRTTAGELEIARHIRDTIAKNEDTKAVYKMLTDMQRAYESRVLMDSGEGRTPSGERYAPEDFWVNVGEVRGLRWLSDKVRAMVDKADKADEEERKRHGRPDSNTGS
jgi:hypothetical protein